MGWVEILGFVTGAVCVWLAARESVWNFPVGIANTGLFLALFTSAGLIANAGLQVVNLVLNVLGWYWWLRGGKDHGALDVRRTPRMAWLVGVVAVGLLTAGLTVLLRDVSAAPFWDSLTTSLSLVAQLMTGVHSAVETRVEGWVGELKNVIGAAAASAAGQRSTAMTTTDQQAPLEATRAD